MVDLRDKAKKPLSEIDDAKKRLLKAQKKLARSQIRNAPLEISRALTALKVAQADLAAVQKLHSALITQLDREENYYAKQLEHREKFRLRPKRRMATDGSRRYIVPDTSGLPVVGAHRFTGKTVTIEADITADGNPGGQKHEQHLTYSTPLWRRIYALRNGVESVNRNYKRAQFHDLQNADRRHVRGNTFTYIVANLAAVCENLRKLLNFLKEQLSLRAVTSKNSGVPTLSWHPNPHADDIEPPIRR